MNTKQITALLIMTAFVTGCAKSSSEIATTYVSPIQYQSYSCDQVSAEMSRVTTRVSELGGRLDEASSNDAAITGIGLILFWPVLFALGGTKSQEAEYGRLKGEYDALNQVAIQKQCTMQFNVNPATGSATAVTPANQQTAPTVADGVERITITNATSANVSAPAATEKKLTISEASDKCKALGITSGTEQFGKCVLTLSK